MKTIKTLNQHFTSLSNKIFHRFKYQSIDPKKDLQLISDKLKLKQTVNDKKKLQRFLETQISSGKFYQNLQRTQKHDKEFQEFLKQYQKNHKEHPTILDLSQYTRNQGLYNKTNEMRKEELSMLEEFRDRQQKSMFSREQLEDDLDNMPGSMGSFDEQEHQTDETRIFGDYISQGSQLKKSIQEDEDLDYDFNSLATSSEFVILILDNDVTTNVTKLNRINSFRYLIFMGNAQGIIGYGKGKGNDFEEAFDNAVKNCQKNLIAIPTDWFVSLPQDCNAYYNGLELRIMANHCFNAWGNPVIASMLLLTGIRHAKFKLIQRNICPYALTYVYFKAITQNITTEQVCESLGQKIYQTNFGKPNYINSIPKNLI